MALGYEDIIDHDTLRFDPALREILGDSLFVAPSRGQGFLPLYVFCGRHLLPQLRPANIMAPEGRAG